MTADVARVLEARARILEAIRAELDDIDPDRTYLTYPEPGPGLAGNAAWRVWAAAGGLLRALHAARSVDVAVPEGSRGLRDAVAVVLRDGLDEELGGRVCCQPLLEEDTQCHRAEDARLLLRDLLTADSPTVGRLAALVEARLSRARALHRPRELPAIHPVDAPGGRPAATECGTCRTPWPCPTATALDGGPKPPTSADGTGTRPGAPEPCCAPRDPTPKGPPPDRWGPLASPEADRDDQSRAATAWRRRRLPSRHHPS